MAEPAPIAPVAAEDLRLTASTHWLTRFLFFRLLGLVYVVAFLVVLWQWEPLLGSARPASRPRLPGGRAPLGGRRRQRLPAPALALLALRLGPGLPHRRLGRLRRVARAARGLANVPLLAVLWFLYMSFVHVGGLLYGYGWEIQLLETGFLAIFLSPLWRPAAVRARARRRRS